MPTTDDDLLAGLAAGLRAVAEDAPTQLALSEVRRQGARRRRRIRLAAIVVPTLAVLLLALAVVLVRQPHGKTTLAATPTPAVSRSGPSSAPVPPSPVPRTPTPIGLVPSPVPSPLGELPATPGDPADLVGLWRVVDAPGAEAGTVLRLDADQAILLRHCGDLQGAWKADGEGVFLASFDGGAAGCGGPHHVYIPPQWIATAAAFRVEGSSIRLLDRTGATVARLLPGAMPSSGPGFAKVTPTLTPALVRSLATPAPLPAGFRPPTAAELVGTWGTAGSPAAQTYGLTFFPNGTLNLPSLPCACPYTRQDGGTWILGPGGDWIVGGNGGSGDGDLGTVPAAQGAATPLPSDYAYGRRIAYDGTSLTFFDAAGKRLGSLTRVTNLQARLLAVASGAAAVDHLTVASALMTATTRNGALAAEREPTLPNGNVGSVWLVEIHTTAGSYLTLAVATDGSDDVLDEGLSEQPLDLYPIGTPLALK